MDSIKIILLLFFIGPAFAVKLSDYQPYKFEVLFTNPECFEYRYPQYIFSNKGNKLFAKPKNVYCSYGDAALSGARVDSPQYRLIELIQDSSTKEIFMAYLSFSSSAITNALCETIKSKDIKLTVVIDEKNNEGDRAQNAMRQVNRLQSSECLPSKYSRTNPNLKVLLRGHTPGIGFAHDKVMIVNPQSKGKTTIVFSSGNISSGVVLHHENWNFVTTHMKSYFAQAHLCLKEGLENYYQSGATFRKFIKDCRASISSKEEDDIKVFFVPGEGAESMNMITQSISKAKNVDIAAHRFSAGAMLRSLTSALKKANAPEIKLVLDDDLYWAGKNGYDAEPVGPNNFFEYSKVRGLERLGLKTRYLETNHGAKLLQHNKFMVFTFRDGSQAVHTGAGNFTTAAFTKNFENFYYIKIPQVVEAYHNQFQKFWHQMSTSWENMPEQDIQL